MYYPNGRPACLISGSSHCASAIALLAAAAGDDHTVRLWDVSGAPRPLPGPPRQPGILRSVASQPGAQVVAYAGDDTLIRLWDVRGEKRVGKPLVGHDTVTSIAFSPDGTLLASGSADTTVRLWNARTHRQIGVPLRGHRRDVLSVAFSPDGKTLATAADDNTIRLWDVQRHAERPGSPLRQHTAPVVSVAFSGDGRTLASSSDDHTVRLWNLADGEPLLSLAGTSTTRALAFSRDSRTLATGDDSNVIRVLDSVLWGDFAALRRRGCALVGQDLDEDEWAQLAAGLDFRQSGCLRPWLTARSSPSRCPSGCRRLARAG